MNTEDSSRVVNGEKVVSPELCVGSSLDDFMKNMHKDWHWWDYLQSWWDYLQSWWYRFFWNWFSSIPSEIKYFIQRGMRGYSDRSWSLDRHLTISFCVIWLS